MIALRRALPSARYATIGSDCSLRLELLSPRRFMDDGSVVCRTGWCLDSVPPHTVVVAMCGDESVLWEAGKELEMRGARGDQVFVTLLSKEKIMVVVHSEQ